MHPSIDHTGLSPSGRVSKRARKAWLEREAARLFPPGYFAEIEREHQARLDAEHPARLRHRAADLRALAARGMQTRALTKEAARLEAEADRLDRRLDADLGVGRAPEEG